ncbi:hypothetical protein A2U01_0059762 [Trifolium medium]|uniref:Uncharacterized protein n=1 Tax=Trifolium medium TaxID=97028 RepID=A0A392RR22_9FABA|nr:hypothetical protein [Trifolium medium]
MNRNSERRKTDHHREAEKTVRNDPNGFWREPGSTGTKRQTFTQRRDEQKSHRREQTAVVMKPAKHGREGETKGETEGGEEATNLVSSPSCDATWLRTRFGFWEKGLRF